ncbi:MAG: VOC family protein, partial [Blastocatellia bacterium]
MTQRLLVRLVIHVAAFCLVISVCVFSLTKQSRGQNQTPSAAPAAQATPTNEAHFHHLHLNTTDPQAAINFYTSKFDCEKGKFAGLADAVFAQKSWILFTKVKDAPPWELTSSIWHFGWGAEKMKDEYERQLKLGTKFFTPLTDISDIGGNAGAKDLFYYAYVESPDRALIELNTAGHHNFGHLHLFSADPVSAGEWYVKHLGAKMRGNRTPSREPRFYKGYQIGPNVSLMMDNVNIIIFPAEYLKKDYPDRWKGKVELESTKGHVVDHIGISFDNVTEAVD